MIINSGDIIGLEELYEAYYNNEKSALIQSLLPDLEKVKQLLSQIEDYKLEIAETEKETIYGEQDSD